MHTDRNHSFLPPLTETPWLHVESFLYLSDVHAGTAPTHLVPLRDSVGHSPTEPLIMPNGDPEIYAAERPATGVRGSLLAYRPDVFHRGVDLTDPGGARFLLNVSFKHAGHDWVGYDSIQSTRELGGMGSVRGGLDAEGAGAVRVPRARPSDLGRGDARARPRCATPSWTSHRGSRRPLRPDRAGGVGHRIRNE